jgi:tellurite resistance protein TehA-like permease
MLWLIPLVVAELHWPRLGFRTRRWSTVFPLGMYAACSFTAADATNSAAPREFARAWVWLATAACLLLLAGLVRQAYAATGARRSSA